jgi:hypothetical protein
VDALTEFRNGSRDVARDMKSSFAEAFQSIASGASSTKTALAGMAQSILNSIPSMSASMMSNMFFSSMGFDKIPGLGQNYENTTF